MPRNDGTILSFDNVDALKTALRTFSEMQIAAARLASIPPSRAQILAEKEAALLRRAAELGIDVSPDALKMAAATEDDIPF